MKKAVMVVLFLLLLINPKIAQADGMVIIPPDPYSDRWDYANETNQQAFINYENGVQKMILNTGISNDQKDKFWLFPIPSDPNEIKVKIVVTIPNFSGEEISGKAKENLDEISLALQSTQLYPALWNVFFGIDTLSIKNVAPGYGSIGSISRTDYSGGQKDVVVYSHLVKDGITTEVISATTPLGLVEYFENKNLTVDPKSILVFNTYIGKKYAFVASWITSKKNSLNSDQKALLITFPTKDMYFPLIPTSVYGERVIPATIRILGHVTPVVPQNIKSKTKTKYYIDDYFNVDDELNNFYNSGLQKNIKYTAITINSPSENFKEDLWIKNTAPLKTYYTSYFAKNNTTVLPVFLIITSAISGAISGLLLFKRERNKKGVIKYSIVGLCNCLLVITLAVVAIFVRTKESEDQGKRLIGTLFVPLFSVIFLIISFLVVRFVKLTV